MRTNENYNKYRLVLGGELMGSFSKGMINLLIRAWVLESGARNITSGVVTATLDQGIQAVVYTVHFDSSHWTGIDFKGFN